METLPSKISGFIIIFLLPAILIAQHAPFTTDGYDTYMPEVRQWNKLLVAYPRLDITTPAGLARGRIVWGRAGGKSILKPQDRFIQGKAGNIRIRIFRPDTIRAVVFDIHGGGWIAGRPENTDSLNDVMARYCKVAV